MTSRQQRRAQERIAQKQTNRHSQTVPVSCKAPEPAKLDLAPPPLSPRSKYARPDYTTNIAAANLAILLPTEDASLYRDHVRHFFHQHTPEAGVETVIVQRLADLQWRLQRIANLEAGIMALGRLKHAELFTESDPAVRIALLDAQTLVSDGAPLRNLHTQETRLRRYYRNDLAELATLQENRQPQNNETYPHADDIGFEFSNLFTADIPEAPEPADCLNSMLGVEFSTAEIGTAAAPR